LEWDGYVVRMERKRVEKRGFLENQGEGRKPGRPK
jgi:hypothetical protein